MGDKKIDYSIVLAAGKGTRFYSTLPKVLHKLSGRTLLERSINALRPHTSKEIIVVAGFGIDLVAKEVENLSQKLEFPKIRIVHQKEQLGTGHAAKIAIEELANLNNQDSIMIIPGDCPLIESNALSEFVSKESKSALSVLSLKVENPFGFGRILRNSLGQLTSIVEEKDATEEERKICEINSSIFIGSFELFKKYLPKLSNSNKQAEYYLTDVVSAAVRDDVKIGVYASSDTESFLGANSRRELYVLQEKKRMKDLNLLMERGVTIQSTSTCFIDDTVEIGKDVFIGSSTRILGSTKIADGVIIEGDALIRDSEIGANVHLKIGAYLDECKIEEGSTLGPFVHIRPKSHLKKNVKIGNFVEVKASILEEGVKANHLTYLGDIDIDENSNIGAGTIICNYDGKNKTRSKIGRNSFVGSNSTIVSPVEIGNESYVAAGSVITKNVPDDALAIARGKQDNKQGWVSRKKNR